MPFSAMPAPSFLFGSVPTMLRILPADLSRASLLLIFFSLRPSRVSQAYDRRHVERAIQRGDDVERMRSAIFHQ
ncbi:hypothetical protein MTX20_00485 (plasmid) [Bradyrhizobium sp. ISRA435]|nr:hypothetical protein MTX20_00485 [Bradyrhizobium sp. ISRA435]